MRTRNPHGVTLVEMLVAVAASAIVLVGVIGAVRAQQDAFQGGQRVREAQGASRNALLFIEQKLALAGWGMDPVLAFDLSGQPGDLDGVIWTAGPCPAAAAPCVKDRIDGSDELVFFSRNPSYWIPPPDPPPAPGLLRGRVWQVAAFDPANDTVTVAARAGDLFLKGQILQGVCDQGQGQRYFTVADNFGETTGVDAVPVALDKNLVLTLMPDVLANPFRRQSAGECPPTRIFQIDRYRFHVRPDPVGDGRHETYLMLDSGVDVDRDGLIDERDERILAQGVEILQVGYHFTPNIDVAAGTDTTLAPVGYAPGLPIAVRGGTSATATTAADTITRTSFAASAAEVDSTFYKNATFYEFRFGPPLAPQRTTNHAANLSAIQVSLVTRSDSPNMEPGGGLLPGAQAPVLNMNQTPAWILTYAATRGGKDGYERTRLDTTVHLPNLVARRLLYD